MRGIFDRTGIIIMKKIISIAVAVLMVATLFAALPFAVSADEAPATPAAPEGTAVKTTEEFMAMADGGTYYLDADITVSEMRASFSGTLDGNGHTITTTVALFNNLGNATIKNLTLAGDITAEGWNAALAINVVSTATVTIENVVNSANVSGKRVGGFITDTAAGATVDGVFKPTTVKFINCERTGTTDGTELVGGFLAYPHGDVLEMTDCKNTGKITSTGYAAGLVARFGPNATYSADMKATFTNCVNTAEVNSSGEYAGGILAYSRGSYIKFDSCVNEGKVTNTSKGVGGIAGYLGAKDGQTVVADFVKCVNKGEIVLNKIDAGGSAAAGAMAGYVYGVGKDETGRAGVDSCINLGTITTGWYGSQFIGYCNSKYCFIKNSIAAGSVKALEGTSKFYSCVIGCSSADLTACEIKNVFYLENDGTEYYSYATAKSNSANRVKLSDYLSAAATKDNITVVTAEDLASGKVAYRLNKAAGENVVYQTLGTDTVPVLDNTHGVVYLNNGAYSNTAPDPNDTSTEPVEDTTADGGDNTTTESKPNESDKPGDNTTENKPGENTTTENKPTDSKPTDSKPTDTTGAAGESGCGGCGGFAAAAQAVALLVGVAGVALVVKRK